MIAAQTSYFYMLEVSLYTTPVSINMASHTPRDKRISVFNGMPRARGVCGLKQETVKPDSAAKLLGCLDTCFYNCSCVLLFKPSPELKSHQSVKQVTRLYA